MAWLPSWTWRRKITVAGSDVEDNLINFPICLILSFYILPLLKIYDIFHEGGEK